MIENIIRWDPNEIGGHSRSVSVDMAENEHVCKQQLVDEMELSIVQFTIDIIAGVRLNMGLLICYS